MPTGAHQRVELVLQRLIMLLRLLGPQWAERRVGIEFAGCSCGASFEPGSPFFEAPIQVFGESKGFIRIDPGPEIGASGEVEALALAQLVGSILELTPRQPDLSREDFRQSDKMSYLATLIPGVSHDLNNPISTATLSAENLATAWKTLGPVLEAYVADRGMFHVGHMSFTAFNEMVPGLIAGILSSLRQIHELTGELRKYIETPRRLQTDTLDMNAVLRSALALMAGKLKKSTYRLHVVYGPNLPPVRGEYQALEQAIINLIDHACQTLPSPQKSIHISTAYESHSATIVITIGNESDGGAEEKTYDPFGLLCPEQADAGAFGHALAVAADIIDSQKGRLGFILNAGNGVTAKIRLPVCAVPAVSMPDSQLGTLLNSR